MKMITFIFLIFFSFIIKCAGADEHHLEPFITHEFDVVPHKRDSYCFQPSADLVGFSTIFDELCVEVKDAGGDDFPWHAIKGISTDDFHSHIEHLVMVLLNEKDRLHRSGSEWLMEKHSFIRDVLSSCPSPLTAKNLHSCSMRFSTFGKSCVHIFAEKPHHVSIRGVHHFHMRHVYNLFAGIILIALAPMLSKSKIFQYTTGASSFMIAGAVIIILYFITRFLSDRRGRGSNWLRDAFVGTVITTGYGASVVYFLRHNMRSLVLQYWEWVLGYAAISCLVGLLWIRSVRSQETSKAKVRSYVLWAIRFVGVICVYNSSASPMGSLILLAILIIIYIIYALYKQVITKLTSKKSLKHD